MALMKLWKFIGKMDRGRVESLFLTLDLLGIIIHQGEIKKDETEDRGGEMTKVMRARVKPI